MITQSDVKANFKYNPDNGELIRFFVNGKEKIAGHIHHSGYRSVWFKSRQWMAHRLIWLLVYGEMPKGEIDHINGIRTDNRIENLRDVTAGQNARNRPMRKDNTSGYTGVSWNKTINKWAANITVDGKRKTIGSYKTKQEAIEARKNARKGLDFTDRHGEKK